MPKLDLRKGTKVRYEPVHSGTSRDGVLVRPSANQEEWLVKNELGKFWIHVTRLRPAEDDPAR
jgi:hypothetical protein